MFFLVCFSVVSRTSFENVKTNWFVELKKHSLTVPTFLIGTKIDLREDENTLKVLEEDNIKVITKEEGMELAKEMGALKYFECSALTLVGLKTIFDYAARAPLNIPLEGFPVKPSIKCYLS